MRSSRYDMYSAAWDDSGTALSPTFSHSNSGMSPLRDAVNSRGKVVTVKSATTRAREQKRGSLVTVGWLGPERTTRNKLTCVRLDSVPHILGSSGDRDGLRFAVLPTLQLLGRIITCGASDVRPQRAQQVGPVTELEPPLVCTCGEARLLSVHQLGLLLAQLLLLLHEQLLLLHEQLLLLHEP